MLTHVLGCLGAVTGPSAQMRAQRVFLILLMIGFMLFRRGARDARVLSGRGAGVLVGISASYVRAGPVQ